MLPPVNKHVDPWDEQTMLKMHFYIVNHVFVRKLGTLILGSIRFQCRSKLSLRGFGKPQVAYLSK